MILHALALLAFALASIPALTAIANLLVLAATRRTKPGPGTLVSILIPARNEEGNISRALDAALLSRGVAFEILVMDDGSTDRTARIVRDAAARDERVRLLTAPPLAEGWTGKVHACHHLSLAAKGTHLFFVDADVRLAPDAAATLAGRARKSGAALVSAVPRQEMGTLGEVLTVPMINLLLLGYLPVRFMRLSSHPAFGAACGQAMLVEREAYRAAGGHLAIRDCLHDGIKLARTLRRAGHRTDLLLGHRLAVCRMYRGFDEAWAGFAKNAREGMARPAALPVWTGLLAGGHLLPFALLPLLPTPPVVLAASLSLATRALITLLTRESVLSIPLHPVTVLVGLLIQWSALLRIGSGSRAAWRGRLYPVG